jgi:cytochrome c553
MKITTYKTKCLPYTILIVVGVLVLVFAHSDVIAYYQATYGESAHGNTSYGVNRSDTGYPVGSCAHCHDTFDSTYCGDDPNGLMLFAPNDNPTPTPQFDNFCFECHKGSGSVQVRDGGLKNHTYSTNFGGGAATFTTIYDAFNPATGDTPSSHSLSDVQTYIAGKAGFSTDVNPCIACHNHHTARQHYPVTANGVGGVKTAIRRPTDHENMPANLWGDEDFATSGRYELTNEYFEAYGFTYQAPYYKGGSNYEPAGDNTSDGSKLPNVILFCLDCHKHPVPSTERGGANLRVTILENDQHGLRHEDGGMGYTIAPYGNASRNYILSCTDCHEPHGSENEWLLRTCVNGKDNISIPPTGKGKWWDFCTACHVLTNGTDAYHKPVPTSPQGCPDCHYHGAVLF